MSNRSNELKTIQSISAFHKAWGLPSPTHPLISLVNFEDINPKESSEAQKIVLNFYTVAIKRDFKGKFKYGQGYYDFDEGVISFIAPGQVVEENVDHTDPISGWLLLIHPDFLRGYELEKSIKNFGFFSYALTEALYLSKEEEKTIENTMKSIQTESQRSIDLYSQDVMISYLEVLFNYSNRFYNRQFITRKHVNNNILSQLETLLQEYFKSDAPQNEGIPTVGFVASTLNISANYLSDVLKTLTGNTAQQYIHLALISKSKEYLTTTSLSISEIAFLLGFEHSQSFSRLFKKKTELSPVAFRKSFKI